MLKLFSVFDGCHHLHWLTDPIVRMVMMELLLTSKIEAGVSPSCLAMPNPNIPPSPTQDVDQGDAGTSRRQVPS